MSRTFFWILNSVLVAILSQSPAFGTEAKPDRDMRRFIDRLMAKMTVEEKVGQLVQYTADMAVTGASVRATYKDDIKAGRVGSIFNAYTPKFTRELQELAVTGTRLKIPLLFGYDVIHGHRTIFPIPLGESASWDIVRIEQAARIAAIEASADGIHWTFAPMVDISRDPRWGRMSEGAGEDPWLGSRIAEARVRGLQGPGIGGTDTVLACVKHFAGYGAPVGGRDYNIMDVSERTLYETYLPTYEAAVRAGAATVMTAFNEVNGTPATSSPWLLTEILRNDWGFKGFVVTDYTAVNELIPHGVAADEKQAARLAFSAGADMDMQGGVYARHLPDLVKSKAVSRKQLDQSVRRVLEAKYKLGLFSDPYRFSNEDRAKANLMAPAHLAAARDVARRSIVLLKNSPLKSGQAALPIKRTGTIAVIGPFAEDQRNLIGNWSAAGDWKQAVSLVDGMKARLGDTQNKFNLTVARGANVSDDQVLVAALNSHGGDIKIDPRSNDQMISEAVKVAKKADVVILALGETQGMSGEAASRSSITLPESQRALLRAVKKTGKPIVLVLFNGRPLALAEEHKTADAILETWFLGTQSGHAIADVLFGDYNPSGKLPVSFPHNEGQIPVYYSAKPTGRPFDAKSKYTSKYLDVPNEALYPFGWGLSYTKFDYSDLKLSTKSLKPNKALDIAVTVKNVGARAGEETVQLYTRDLVASVTRPVKELRNFKKVFLNAGESREVRFQVTLDDLRFYNQKMQHVAEPGEFLVMVGGNSLELKQATFALQNGPELSRPSRAAGPKL